MRIPFPKRQTGQIADRACFVKREHTASGPICRRYGIPMGPAGFEPATSNLKGWRSDRLSYGPTLMQFSPTFPAGFAPAASGFGNRRSVS